jgi:hypothetical protein
MTTLHVAPSKDWKDALRRTEDTKRAAIENSRGLEPLAGTFVWSGKILPGALGPGSPEAEMSGRTESSWVNDGLYLLIQGDYRYRVEDVSGSFWKFDYFLGYDPLAKRYRQWLADNVGLAIKDCTLEGTRLIVDFPQDARIESGGHTIVFRQIYDWSEANLIKNTFEVRVDGGEWVLVADLIGRRQ